MLEKLLAVLEAPVDLDGESVKLGASLGIAVFPNDGLTADELLCHSDQALTDAKRSGKGRFEFFTSSIGEAEERRNSIEFALRDAIDRDELSLHYQPIWCSRSGRLTGTEALIRWHSGVLGTVSPGDFIPIAEQSGLINRIGLHSLKMLCLQIAVWKERYGSLLPRVSTNLSAVQVLDSELVEGVGTVLDETGVPGEWLEFELTEGSILARDPIAEATLSTLRGYGSTLALDDFGTGYSSLSHLRHYRFERIKIDRTFVNGLGDELEDEELTRAVIALAQRLGMETVAEGVETEQQHRFLRDEGCDHVQGFLLGRPVTPERFADFLRGEGAHHSAVAS